MSRLTIIREDAVVVIGGIGRRLDLTGFPADVWAVQGDTLAGSVDVELNNGNHEQRPRADFQPWIDQWEAARDQEQAERDAAERTQKRSLQARMLELSRVSKEYEEGGFQWHGHTLYSTRETRATVVVAANDAREGVWDPVPWPTMEGNFVEPTGAEVLEIFQGYKDHVRKAYKVTAQVAADIKQMTDDQREAMDLAQMFKDAWDLYDE